MTSLYFTSGRTERIVSASHAAVELGIASSFDGSVLAIVFEEMGVLPTANVSRETHLCDAADS